MYKRASKFQQYTAVQGNQSDRLGRRTLGVAANPEWEPDETLKMGPPPSWSRAAMREWAYLSKPVRDAVWKREKEIDNGFKQYAGIRPYAQEAIRRGESLLAVIKRGLGEINVAQERHPEMET